MKSNAERWVLLKIMILKSSKGRIIGFYIPIEGTNFPINMERDPVVKLVPFHSSP